jgi:hypothetical protein
MLRQTRPVTLRQIIQLLVQVLVVTGATPHIANCATDEHLAMMLRGKDLQELREVRAVLL